MPFYLTHQQLLVFILCGALHVSGLRTFPVVLILATLATTAISWAIVRSGQRDSGVWCVLMLVCQVGACPVLGRPAPAARLPPARRRTGRLPAHPPPCPHCHTSLLWAVRLAPVTQTCFNKYPPPVQMLRICKPQHNYVKWFQLVVRDTGDNCCHLSSRIPPDPQCSVAMSSTQNPPHSKHSTVLLDQQWENTNGFLSLV